jgi:hypothetical protein
MMELMIGFDESLIGDFLELLEMTSCQVLELMRREFRELLALIRDFEDGLCSEGTSCHGCFRSTQLLTT